MNATGQGPTVQRLPGPDAEGPRWFVLGRRPALDGLRALAILAVMAVHTPCTHVPGGFIGVDVFFVLSGFLITSLLVQERQAHGSIALGRFYLRRTLRLLPALLGLLLVIGFFTLDWGTRDQLRVFQRDSLSILLYYYNWHRMWSTAASFPWLSPLWSLSVEEQFYLLWPPVLAGLLALQVRRRWIVGLLVVGIVCPAVLRAVFRRDDFAYNMGLYICTVTRADALSMGSLVALLASWGALPLKPTGRRLLRVGGGIAFLVLAFHLPFTNINDAYMFRCGYSVVALAAATVIAALIWAPPPLLPGLLEVPLLGWIGRISYGAYLWNGPVWLVVSWRMGNAHFMTQSALIWAGTLTAGALSHTYLEMPFLRLKHRLETGKAPSVEGDAPRLAA